MSTTAKKKELIIGVVMIAVSLAYMVMAYQLPGHDGIDAGTLPVLLACFLTLLGVFQLVSALSKKAPDAEAPAPAATAGNLPEVPKDDTPPDVIEPKTVLLTLGLILGYMALLGPVGFPIITVVYLYLQFLVLTPVAQKPRHVTYLLIAAACSAAIFLLFREAFDLMLPAGLLNNFI